MYIKGHTGDVLIKVNNSIVCLMFNLRAMENVCIECKGIPLALEFKEMRTNRMLKSIINLLRK